MRTELTQLVERLSGAAGQATRAAGRLMSLMEDQPWRLADLLAAWSKHHNLPQPHCVLGITGAPGSGKSTLTDAIINHYRQSAPNDKIGVIAVDPSSPYTGGALLGDRVRMMRHATDPNVFIRSLSARGHLGGLTLGVHGVATVMAMIGCQRILIETVGVGQSEVEVSRVADLVAVVLAPGQGDSIQMLKAGLLEIADLLVINKADRPDAEKLHQQLLSAMCITHEAKAQVDVCCVSATEKTGIDTLIQRIQQQVDNTNDLWPQRRRMRIHHVIRESILERARHLLAEQLNLTDQNTQAILSGQATLQQVTDELLQYTAMDRLSTI